MTILQICQACIAVGAKIHVRHAIRNATNVPLVVLLMWRVEHGVMLDTVRRLNGSKRR